MKKSPTCGKDGVSAEMMSAEMLKSVKFNRWQYFSVVGRVVWPRLCGGSQPNVACPQKEMCTPDTFRGIALTSVVYKVSCMIFIRLSDVVDEFHLLVKSKVVSRRAGVAKTMFLPCCWLLSPVLQERKRVV